MAMGRVFSRGTSQISTALVLVIFWMIAAFRFETGYDWLVYEAYFNAIDLQNPLAVPVNVVAMEPFYHVLNYFVRLITDDFQGILIVVATINTICVSKFIIRAKVPLTFGLAFYFCWVYLPLQMGTIRQSIAVSFVLLSMIAYADRRNVKAISWFLIAIGFQYSILLYIPAFIGRLTRFVKRHIWWFLLFVISVYLGGVGFGFLFMKIGSNIGIPFISEKIATYQEIGLAGRSFGGTIYLVMNCALLAYSAHRTQVKDRFDEMIFGCLILLVAVHALFFDFPLLWNRVQYLAVLPQAILFYNLIEAQKLSIRVVAFGGLMMLSLGALAYQISGPMALPFTPYYSYVEYFLTDDPGTGRDRTFEFYKEFENR